jgi:hypothetical protein
VAFVLAARTEFTREVERRRWDMVAAGAAVWVADWFNQIVNALVLEATDRAPLWAATGPTAYQFLVGLNIEISFTFAIALGLSVVSVAAELFLHASGTFHREYWWWNTPFVLPIVVVGYLWFYLFAAWVFDAPSSRQRWKRVGALAALDVLMGLVFGVGLGSRRRKGGVSRSASRAAVSRP